MRIVIYLIVLFTFAACSRSKSPSGIPHSLRPTVSNDGVHISISDSTQSSFFHTAPVIREDISSEITAPGSIQASVIPATGRNTILFGDPELNSAYAQYLQHGVNIRQYKINLARLQDLAVHGAATGKEVQDAEAQLANEEAAVTEPIGKFRLAGLDAEMLTQSQVREVWIICEVPEGQVGSIGVGAPATITFAAFHDQVFRGKIAMLGADVDKLTRMVKVCIILANPANKFEVGMFATASILVSETNALSVPTSSVVNVEGRDFVFVRKSAEQFERREVVTGQQLRDRIVILKGLQQREEVVVSGAMQLKGLSFGY